MRTISSKLVDVKDRVDYGKNYNVDKRIFSQCKIYFVVVSSFTTVYIC